MLKIENWLEIFTAYDITILIHLYPYILCYRGIPLVVLNHHKLFMIKLRAILRRKKYCNTITIPDDSSYHQHSQDAMNNLRNFWLGIAICFACQLIRFAQECMRRILVNGDFSRGV